MVSPASTPQTTTTSKTQEKEGLAVSSANPSFMPSGSQRITLEDRKGWFKG